MSSSGKHKGMGGAMLVVSAGVLSSRVLGFLRDVVLASVWGTGLGMGIWVAAFRIPNLARALFGEGSFTSAFVPVFSETLEKDGASAAWRAACRVVSVLTLVLGALVVVTALICLGLLFVSSGGLHRGAGMMTPEALHRQDLCRQVWLMTPVLMPYALLICVAVAWGGVLNTFRRFAVPALTPLILNVLMIVAAGGVWWTQIHGRTPAEIAAVAEKGTGIWWLVPAVLLAGVLHVWVHLHAAKKAAGGDRFHFEPALRAPEVRKVATLMAPALIGTGLIQFNILLDTVWATMLGPAALASLYFSQRIIYLPVGLFGVASSVVSLPAMSQSWARNERQEFCGQLAHSLRSVLFMCLPMTALLIVLDEPIVRLVFQRGSFGESSVDATLWALIFYLPGIPFFSLVKPMANGFFARQDTRTPVLVTMACLSLNVVLNLLVIAPHAWPGSLFALEIVKPLQQGGLAFSTTLCSMLNLFLLALIFRRRTGLRVFHEVGPAFIKIFVATGVAALAAMLVLNGTRVIIDGKGPVLLQRLFTVLVPLGAGYGAYIAAAWVMGCEELKELAMLIFTKLRRKKS